MVIRVLAVFCLWATVSCAAPTAIFTVPDKKDLTLLATGTSRDRVIKEFGPPAATYTDRDTGSLHDVFLFGKDTQKVSVPECWQRI